MRSVKLVFILDIIGQIKSLVSISKNVTYRKKEVYWLIGNAFYFV